MRLSTGILRLFILAAATSAQAREVAQLPIHVVYVNHVEVESVIDYDPKDGLEEGMTYTATADRHEYTGGRIAWEITQAEKVGARISFHMSGAFAEMAAAAGHRSLWEERLAAGHTAGVHFHSFLRGPSPFLWTYRKDPEPSQDEIEQAWLDNHDLAAGLVGADALWIGESHYSCGSCIQELGYRLGSNEQLAELPAGQHIVWLVEAGPGDVVSFPHFPQIGKAGEHGPDDNETYFDQRVPQFKKEFLMLYMEWLERERLGLAPQVWAWGWLNHGGNNTERYADDIEEMLSWLSENFVGKTSRRGNGIARFVSDHQLSDVYDDYEQWGEPLPSPRTTSNDQFPYMAWALADAGVTGDLSDDLGLDGIRLFELERDPAEEADGPLPRVYLFFRETDGSDTVDASGVLASRGVYSESLSLIDVVGGTIGSADPKELVIGPTPLVLEYEAKSAPDPDSPFGILPASVSREGYDEGGFVDGLNIGVRWHRESVPAYWFLIQPDLGSRDYDFSTFDELYGAVPREITILANIAPEGGPDDHGRCQDGTWIPVDEDEYVAFVKATVDRYNGDGDENDMEGLTSPIRYWQVGNEPNNENYKDRTGFGKLQRITYQAIKEACPDCTVLIGGVAGNPEGYVAGFDSVYGPILADLAGEYVDAFDFHWYGTAGGEYRFRDTATAEDVLDHIRSSLAAGGFPEDIPLWITEMGSYSGDPVEERFPYQTERQQALDHFKRYVYSLSRGVEKVFLAFGLMEGSTLSEDGYFDHTGLVYDGDGDDPGLGVKKLSYYTYKKMTEKLEGADWSTLTTLRDGTGGDHLNLFRVERDGRTIQIAWWDYFDEGGYAPGDTKEMTLTGLSGPAVVVTTAVPAADTGGEVSDYATAFTVATYRVFDGSVTIPLGEDPVMIEEPDPLLFVMDSGAYLYGYGPPAAGDLTYWDALARNPSPLSRDLWAVPRDDTTVAMAEGGAAGRDLLVLKAAGGLDQNLYLYNAPLSGDWTYWDAAARNPSALARDLWVIPRGNDVALMADGGGYIALLKDEGGDCNLYLYEGPSPGDWTYWDAAARNPSPLARDLWLIPQGNDAVALCGLDTAGDGDADSLLVVRNQAGDYNAYLWKMPAVGDWTYWDALARNPSPLSRDLWSIPRRGHIESVVGVGGESGDELGVMENEEGDYNFYLWSAPSPGDWTYWDAAARNPSSLARDFWLIPSGNAAVSVAAPR